jgi:hypothetical protein
MRGKNREVKKYGFWSGYRLKRVYLGGKEGDKEDKIVTDLVNA